MFEKRKNKRRVFFCLLLLDFFYNLYFLLLFLLTLLLLLSCPVTRIKKKKLNNTSFVEEQARSKDDDGIKSKHTKNRNRWFAVSLTHTATTQRTSFFLINWSSVFFSPMVASKIYYIFYIFLFHFIFRRFFSCSSCTQK